MPALNCAVAGCTANMRPMFGLPKDPEVRSQWADVSGNARLAANALHKMTSHRFCSRHFKDDDFQRDLKNELLGLPPEKKLKPDAVPSLFLSDGNGEDKGDDDDDDGPPMDVWQRKALVEEALRDYEDKKRLPEEEEDGPPNNEKKKSLKRPNAIVINYGKGEAVAAKTPKVDLEASEDALNRSRLILRHSRPADFRKLTTAAPLVVAPALVSSQEEQRQPMQVYVKTRTPSALPHHLCIKQVSTKSRGVQCCLEDGLQTVGSLHADIRKLKATVAAQKRAFSSKSERLKALKRWTKLSDAQIRWLVHQNHKVADWKLPDVVLPLIQLSLSHKAYVFAVKTSPVPLPSLSVLKNWSRKLKQSPELMAEALKLIDDDNGNEDPTGVRFKFIQAVKGAETALIDDFQLHLI